MADDKKPAPVNSADAQALQTMPRIRRELVQKKNAVDDMAKGLHEDLARLGKESPIKGLNAAIAAEIDQQNRYRQQIEQARKDIRELRKDKSAMSEERNSVIEEIRSTQLRKRENQLIATSKDSSPDEKNEAKKNSEQANHDILQLRKSEASLSADIAGKSTQITQKVGEVEESASHLSESRHKSRELNAAAKTQTSAQMQLSKAEGQSATLGGRVSEFDEQRKERRLAQAERITPSSVANDIRRRQPGDPDSDAYAAGQKIRQAGGYRSEQKDTEAATREFSQLVESIKNARKELAHLTEGTEEYSAKQAEVGDMESKASDAMSKVLKIEKDVESRGMGGGGAAGIAERGGQMMGAGLRFGSEMTSRFGGLATSRFTIEEERKNAELRLEGRQLSDTRNRATDATAFLATGGAERAGGESPYAAGGERAKTIGQDFANTQRAIPQLILGLNTAARAAELTGKVAGAALKGAAQGEALGPEGMAAGAAAAAGGELLEGGTKFAVDTTKETLLTPEFTAGVGGGEAARRMKEGIGEFGQAVTSGGQTIASTMAVGGQKSGDLAAEGVGKIGDAITKLGQALPTVAQRANEATNEMTKLTAAQETLTQIERERERLAIAFAPQVQKYLDTQPQNLQGMRSRTMSPEERNKESASLDKFAVDRDLGERGFGPDDIARNAAGAARTLGRFGSKGRSQGLAREAMTAESMGLGNADQSIAGTGRLLRAGAQDPTAMFKTAVTEGLMRGIQDSHQFQELLSGISEIAQNTGEAEGALQGVLRTSGSGRGDDMKVAIQGFKDLQERMSGKSGTWMDMVKHSVTQDFAGDVEKQAKKSGVSLDKDDLTTIQGLTNYKPEELRNNDLMNTVLSPNVRKVLEKMDEGKGQGSTLGGLADTYETRGTMDQAITSTQSKELLNVRNMITSKDKAGLQNRYGTEGNQTQEQIERLQKDVALLYSGGSGYSDTNVQAANAQRTLNDVSNITGNKNVRKAIRYHAGDYEQQNSAKVAADAKAANNMPEQQARAQAEIGAVDYEKGTEIAGGAEGATQMGRSRSKYVKQLDATTAKATASKTVAPSVVDSEKVARLDQEVNKMIEGVKDITKAMKEFSFKSAAMNIAGDVVVQGANAIKGVLLDNAVTSVIQKAGTEVADAVSSAMNRNAPAPAQGGTKPSPTVVPQPHGSK